ncbi:MAG: O-antigen ligase family protein, partial [Verrucomicrobiales bacterium]
MPPNIASLLTLGFVIFLFQWDAKNGPKMDSALWIPFWWITIACSREWSDWFAIFGIPLPGGSFEGGNPINRAFYLGLILLGLRILSKRSVQIGGIFANNIILTLFLAYCFVSIAWTELPFVALKRWIKVVGQPIMALIILTEPDPKRALIQVFKRCAFILLPVSILLIKYYPEIGRGFGVWSGQPFNMGITDGKNSLGVNCLLLGYLFTWHWIRTWRLEKGPSRKRELMLCALLLYMNGWLTWMSDSKTPLVSLVLGLSILIFTGMEWVNKKMVSVYLVGAGLAYAIADWFFNVFALILHLLGRDATLTERTQLWPVLLKEDINPVFGVGFESFWIGKRLERLWETLNWECNSAHNGYLETYLTLGLVGLGLLLAVLLATYARSARDLL